MMKKDKATCKYNGVPNPVAQAKSKHLEKPEESEATGYRLLWWHTEYTNHAPVTSTSSCTRKVLCGQRQCPVEGGAC